MSDTFKFFAYLKGSYWQIQELLSMTQIYGMLRHLNWKHQVFATIQSYDEHGNIIGAPLWFDLDGKPDDVLSDARLLVAASEFVLNVTPRIYFSGSKGFHFIIERFIDHPRVHELVADFCREMYPGLRTLDPKVYRTRSMFRIPQSPASKPGYFKIELTRHELFGLKFDEIAQLASVPRLIESQHDVSKLDETVFDDWLAVAVGNLQDYSTPASLENIARSVDMEVTPCIADMLTRPVPTGERNLTVYTLAKFFRQCDLDQQSVFEILMRQPHYQAFEMEGREVSKVLKSVYTSKKPQMIGCRGQGSTAELMRTYCAAPCHFREDFDHNPFLPV